MSEAAPSRHETEARRDCGAAAATGSEGLLATLDCTHPCPDALIFVDTAVERRHDMIESMPSPAATGR